MLVTKRWDKSLHVYAPNIASGVSWQSVVPSLLRALQTYGMHIVFGKGHITRIEPLHAPAFKNTADASCPALVLLQLLFGYRCLNELRYAFPDVRVENSNAEVLLNALFPKKYSWVMG